MGQWVDCCPAVSPILGLLYSTAKVRHYPVKWVSALLVLVTFVSKSNAYFFRRGSVLVACPHLAVATNRNGKRFAALCAVVLW